MKEQKSSPAARHWRAQLPNFTAPAHRTARNLCAFAGLDIGESDVLCGWLIFDAACPFCTRVARKVRPVLARRNICVLPLQTPWVQKLMAERNQPLLKEIRFLDAHGNLTGGADALIEVAARIWWARPAARLARLPFFRVFARQAYHAIAQRRHCLTRNPLRSFHLSRSQAKVVPLILPMICAFAALKGAAP